MSNRLFQGVVQQMHDVIGRAIGVMDETNAVVACSDADRIDETFEFDTGILAESNDAFKLGGYTFQPGGGEQHLAFTVFVEGEDEMAARCAALIAVSLENLKEFYDEKYDRANFVKNVILDNILPGDIYLKAREMHFNADVTRAALLIRVAMHNDVSVFSILQNLFPNRNKDFVINLSETDIVLIKETHDTTDLQDLEKLAGSIVDTLSSEFYAHTVVGIGSMVTSIRDLARSFKEAQIALEVGKVFDTEKAIVSFENLGIARLIYQLPTTLGETFLREVFRKGSIENLDQETLFTIQRFFENNLNVSETSRKLFVHRNTLVYRLEKIKKLTGLDLREFDHAIVFKIALMVKKYLTANPVKY